MTEHNSSLERLRFPIGRFEPQKSYTLEQRTANINALRELPELLEKELESLDDAQLNTSYREGGWTVRQLVHHIADSHMNSFIRFKLALTEDTPTILPYNQDAWVQMSDAMTMEPKESLAILKGLHARLVNTLENMSENDYSKLLVHPDWENKLNLDLMLALYGWHSKHHLAHITKLKERMNWS